LEEHGTNEGKRAMEEIVGGGIQYGMALVSKSVEDSGTKKGRELREKAF